MQRIDHIVKPEVLQAQHVVDSVALTWEARQKSRQRLRTAGRGVYWPREAHKGRMASMIWQAYDQG